jgi:hypothetical protein
MGQVFSHRQRDRRIQAWQGTRADGVARSILAKVKTGRIPMCFDPGVADAAVFIVSLDRITPQQRPTSKSKGIATVSRVPSRQSRKDKDALIALLKQAIARL